MFWKRENGIHAACWTGPLLALGSSACTLLPAPEPHPALVMDDLAVHTTPHRVALLDSGWEALRIRIDLIRGAQHSLDLQTYIWDDDEVGGLVAHELVAAARRGVRVRLIVDRLFVGSPRAESLAAQLATVHPNFELKLYNPHANQLSASWIALLVEALGDFDGVNQRAHDKVMVVDGARAILGGRNIANAYFDYAKGMNFKDREVLVEGPVVGDMRASFERFWGYPGSVPAQALRDVSGLVQTGDFARRESLTDYGAVGLRHDLDVSARDRGPIEERIQELLRVVDTVAFSCDLPGKSATSAATPGINPITPTLAGLIRSADESLLIQTPYPVLGQRAAAMYRELRRDHPELSIRISTNSLDSTDHWTVYAGVYRQKRTMIEELEFHVYELKARPGDRRDFVNDFDALAQRTGTEPELCIHSKSLVVDHELALIGSHNLDPRSDHYNTEVMLVVQDARFAAELTRSIERDIQPRNSWAVWKRRRPVLWRYAEEAIEWLSGGIRELTTIDLWPSTYSTSFELREGGRVVAPGAPGFYANYRSVGSFPAVSTTDEKRVLAPAVKVIIGPATPLL